MMMAVFVFAGDFLVVDEKPVKSDAIIVLGGGAWSRIGRGVELYQDGYAPVLVLSGGNLFTFNTTESEMMASQAEDMGVPTSHIILESKSASTYQNALFTKQILVARGLKSAIVVSSTYHMRRVLVTFNRVYAGSGIRLTYCAAQDWFQPNGWWTDGRNRSIVISEYLKIGITLLGLDRYVT